MSDKQRLREKLVELSVSANGKDINEATAAIFRQIQREIYTELGMPLIQMETEEVYFDEVVKRPKSGGFLSRKEKFEIYIKARVILKVKYIEVEGEI